MKYIDADKLTRLLDAKYKEFMGKAKTEGYTTLQYQYMADGIDIAEQLIDSLQQEQPEVDIKKEIKDWCKENVTGVNPIYTADSLMCALLPKCACHFYELGRQAKPEIFDTAAFQKGVEEGRRLEREEMPKWRNYGPNIIKDPFVTDLGSLVVGEKYIRIYELYNLPGFKND